MDDADTSGAQGSNSASDGDGSIINRARELKALPGSFSSNLGRRISPLRTRRDVTPSTPGGGGSVRAIVAWLESSAVSTPTKTPKPKGASAKYPMFNQTPCVLSPLGMRSLYSAPDVEEYSLSMLRYREYFTSRPLGRCLDGKENASGGLNLDRLGKKEDNILGIYLGESITDIGHHSPREALPPTAASSYATQCNQVDDGFSLEVVKDESFPGETVPPFVQRHPEDVKAY